MTNKAVYTVLLVLLETVVLELRHTLLGTLLLVQV